ncbi:MAG: ABC transporter substrate-binding protein [Chloroflexi bacterium]|nr:ABC transporter substrate-binding protein [Chloroflexota bacterium]
MSRGVLSRRRFIAATAGSFAALGLAACARRAPDASAPPPVSVAPTPAPTSASVSAAAATPAPTPAGTPKRGGMLMTATQTDWTTFDSIYNSANGVASYHVYDPLFSLQLDDKGTWHAAPGLIEKWEFTDTSATWNLRKGVTFHDGSPWDAESLKWNVERMISDPKSLAASVLGNLDSSNPITVVDPATVKVNLTSPAPSLAESLACPDTALWTYPISRTAFEKLGPDQFGRNPVGTGPFKFSEWKPSDRVVLTRNENYWMTGADGKSLPYMDGVTFRLIIDDSVRAVELKSHNIDVTDQIAPKDMASVQADPQLTLIQSRNYGNSRRLIYHARGGPFADNLKLRQAVLYAMDRDTLATTLGQGQGDPSKYFLLPGAFGYDDSLPYYSYDLDKARSLMNDAGYPNGLDVSFIIIAREVDKTQAEVLKQMWEKIGVRANIEAQERAALNQRILSGGADYQVTSGQYGNYAGDADIQLRRYMHSKGGFNKAHMSSPELDGLLDKASATYDPPTRLDLYRQAQTLDFNQLAYYGHLWTQWWNWAMNKRVGGWPQTIGGTWDLRGVWLNS